jgi:hypothetical protein
VNLNDSVFDEDDGHFSLEKLVFKSSSKKGVFSMNDLLGMQSTLFCDEEVGKYSRKASVSFLTTSVD